MEAVSPPSAQAENRAPARRAGFSVMELVILIAIMGLLTMLALHMVGTQPVAVRNAKLTSDVATLNHMVSAYLADGGRRAELTNAQAVLDHLKRSRPQSEWKQHTGPVSGRLIDVRLRARMTAEPAKNGQERARWNMQKMRFELTTAGGSAVSEFYLDEALATTDPGTEIRTAPVVRYNSAAGKNQGWVWGYSTPGSATSSAPGSNQGNGVSNPFDPNKEAPLPNPGNGGGGDGGNNGGGGGPGDGDDDDNGPPAPAIIQLPRPAISPTGGTFSYAAFPGNIMLSPNGAPATGSRLEYRINNGAWTAYTGSPIQVGSADKLDARNAATDTSIYRTSNLATANYFRLTSGFTGSGSATWGNATGGSNLVTEVQNGSGGGSSTFKHGNTKLDLGNGQFLDAGVENVLTFTPGSLESITPNTWFDLGDLNMLNGTTFYNSEADQVTLSINLNLTEPAHTGVVHINLGLISTENTDDRMASADIVELKNPNTDFKVTVDGVEYRLELSWATQDAGAGVAQGNQFLVYETATARASLRGRFVPNK